METKFSLEEATGKLWDKLYGWLDAIILKLPNIALAILVMVLFYILARLTGKLFRKVLLKNMPQVSIRRIISKMIFICILLIGFFISLGVLELDKALTSILAGAGVIGLAVGLALQGTLSNTFGGVVLSFLPKIRINDYIETQDTAGFVSEINLRNIVIRRPDNNYVIIPNNKFIEDHFVNYSISPRSRISVSCGVGYESNLEEVEALVVKVISENFTHRSNEEVEFFFTEFGESAIIFVVRFWIDMIKNQQEYAAKHKAIKLIRSAFRENGINIPFPIRTLDFAKNNLRVEASENKQDS